MIPNQGVANYVTQWEYDSWNRLKNMTYPDGEVVNYSYNQGGLLNKVTGTKSGTTTVYVDDIRYDKFEQRTLLKYDNGTQTDYTYNPLNCLMDTLKVQKGSTVLMNNAYNYDAVQNITGKTQNIVQQNLKFNGILSNVYNLSYTYADNSQQIANISE